MQKLEDLQPARSTETGGFHPIKILNYAILFTDGY
jgi:hypothetical protein